MATKFRKSIVLIVLLGILYGFAAAQFSVPDGYMHRSFDPGHPGFPGMFYVMSYWGWPVVCLTQTGPVLDIEEWQVNYWGIAIDTLVVVGATIASARVLSRMGRALPLGTLMLAITAGGALLACYRWIEAPAPWYVAALVGLGLFCLFYTVAEIPLRRFQDWLNRPAT